MLYGKAESGRQPLLCLLSFLFLFCFFSFFFFFNEWMSCDILPAPSLLEKFFWTCWQSLYLHIYLYFHLLFTCFEDIKSISGGKIFWSLSIKLEDNSFIATLANRGTSISRKENCLKHFKRIIESVYNFMLSSKWSLMLQTLQHIFSETPLWCIFIKLWLG